MRKSGYSRRLVGFRLRMVALATLAALVLAVGLAACGGGDGAGGGEEGMDQVTVGLYPVVNFAPLYLGIEQGFFEERGIEVETQLFAGGSEIVPGLVGGDIQIGFSNPVSVFIAQQEGLPLTVISQASQAQSVKDDFSAVYVTEDSPIQSPADLEGQTVAVNLLENIGDVTIKNAIEQDGGDPSAVEFIEIPFPEMNQALEQGQVDAIWNLEPFLTEARKTLDIRVISYPYAETDPRLTNTIGVSSDEFLQSSGDVVDRFRDAYNESLEYANENPDEARQIISTYTEIEPDTLNDVALPFWSSDINEPSLQKLADLMVRYDVIEEPYDVSTGIETE